ncbi:hypothetical protein [Mycobacterium sp.]|uniref:hypothetical protein n=1 Tax=Mycobacterium sp. TaxID=1785 RepID=UPI0026281F40|nr:hypothetical protein [Mycobacterium sp.]
MTQSLADLAAAQDGLLTRTQALAELTIGELRQRLARSWTMTLPGVYATFRGGLTPRQRCRAALLYAGEHAQLADVTALAKYGVRYLPPDTSVHVLIPAERHRASRGFVVVRRTHRAPEPRRIDGLSYCPPERALVEAAARLGQRQTAHAFLADAVGQGIARLDVLAEEVVHVTGRGAGIARRAVTEIAGGARSAPEIDFAHLCRTRRELPEPLLNRVLVLPDGRRVIPDALFPGSPLVHEVNGREFHSGEDLFESMQERHDAMTAAGMTVLHNSPRRIRREADTVVAEVVACYQRLSGQGLPPGVRLLDTDAA